MNGKTILAEDGTIIDLQYVRVIDNVYNYNQDGKVIGYYFDILYNGLKVDDAYHRSKYFFKDYVDTPEELKKKVMNIRMELAKMKNDGMEVKQILGSLNLKKK